MTDTAPSGALTWGSAAERNKRLMPWRRAVSMTFAEQPRCLRVAWALDHLFNAKTGYAYPLNKHLADMTGLPINKVQDALLALESDGAILRITLVTPGGGWPQRLIYPAIALLPTPTVGQPVTPTVGVGGHPQQMGAHNLTTRARLPKSELDRARLAAKLRQEREASELGTVLGCPRSDATGDGEGTRLTEEDAGGLASDRTIAEEEGEWML